MTSSKKALTLWLLIAGVTGFVACAGDKTTDNETDGGGPDAGDTDAGDDFTLDWESLTPVESHREDLGGNTVVWLSGSPFEMGQQQGELLHDEIADGIANSSYIQEILDLIPVATLMGFVVMAENNSYPEVVEECEGIMDTAGDVGWTMELCLIVAFGEVLMEKMPATKALPLSSGCSQFIASGDATADGRLYHGRLLDWGYVDYLLEYPVIFVRQPTGGVPHVTVGFPGNVAPFNGMNAAGLSLASNEADPSGASQSDDEGRGHVQLLGHILAGADSMDAALDELAITDHMSVEGIGIADGRARRGAFSPWRHPPSNRRVSSTARRETSRRVCFRPAVVPPAGRSMLSSES